MVGPKSVFVVSVVNSYLDRDRGVNQPDDGSWDSNEVGVPTVGRTCEPATKRRQQLYVLGSTFRRLMGECLDIISG